MADSQAASGSSFFARLELIAKIVLGAAAIAYAIGVFLVSSDLAQYKVSNFSLARPQYIFAGAAWLATTAVAIGPPLFGAALAKFGVFAQPARFRRILFGVPWVIFCGFILTKSIQILMPVRIWSVMPYTTLAETVFFIIAFSNLPSTKEMHASQDTKTKDHPLVTSGIGFGIAALFIWTGAYTIQIFPNVEPGLGGGKHPTAQVVFCEPEKGKEGQLEEILGPTHRESATTSTPLTVLFVDADFLVIVFEDCDREAKERAEKAAREKAAAGEKATARETPTFWNEYWKVLWMTVRGTDERPKEYKTVLISKSLVAAIRYEEPQATRCGCLTPASTPVLHDPDRASRSSTNP